MMCQRFLHTGCRQTVLFCMGEILSLQVTRPRECLVILDACKRRLSCVQPFIFLHIPRHRESFVILRAAKGLLSCVNLYVSSGYLTERKPCRTWCMQKSSLLCELTWPRESHVALGPVYDIIFFFRSLDWEKAVSHWMQPNDFSPVCDILCVLSSPHIEKALLYWVQPKFFSSVCDILCVFRCSALEKTLPHSVQL